MVLLLRKMKIFLRIFGLLLIRLPRQKFYISDHPINFKFSGSICKEIKLKIREIGKKLLHFSENIMKCKN